MDFQDHPLYLARLRAGLSAQKLATAAGLNPASVMQIEKGRVREPSEETWAALGRALQRSGGSLAIDHRAWLSRQEEVQVDRLPREAQLALKMSPQELRDTFDTFAEWRSRFAPTPTGFASMLGISHMITTEYERGVRARPGLPQSLQRQLLNVLKISPAYLQVLSELTPS